MRAMSPHRPAPPATRSSPRPAPSSRRTASMPSRCRPSPTVGVRGHRCTSTSRIASRSSGPSPSRHRGPRGGARGRHPRPATREVDLRGHGDRLSGVRACQPATATRCCSPRLDTTSAGSGGPGRPRPADRRGDAHAASATRLRPAGGADVRGLGARFRQHGARRRRSASAATSTRPTRRGVEIILAGISGAATRPSG